MRRRATRRGRGDDWVLSFDSPYDDDTIYAHALEGDAGYRVELVPGVFDAAFDLQDGDVVIQPVYGQVSLGSCLWAEGCGMRPRRRVRSRVGTMLLLTLVLPAAAQTCPDIAGAVDRAWALYNDAELDQAKDVLVEAEESLDCQSVIVSTSTLLDLFRLAGLVSLSNQDVKGAIYATLRAVAVDHTGARPPERYGPQLAELYDTWSGRMGQSLIRVRVDGAGSAWVDGRPADPVQSLEVAQGEHLLQIDDGQTVRSAVADLSADYLVNTGVDRAAPVAPELVLPEPVLPEPVVPEPVLPEPVVPTPVPRTTGVRRRPGWLWGPAVLTAAGAGFAISSGLTSERSFNSDPYAPRFVDCGFDEPCYTEQREALVRHNARIINTAYGVGYGLVGATAGLLTMTVVGLPGRQRRLARWQRIR